MTFEEALNLIPTHIMLNAGAPLIKGDETLEYQDADYGEWEVDVYPLGHGVGGFTHARRPIPETVRGDEAQNMLSVFHQGQKRNDTYYRWLKSTQERI